MSDLAKIVDHASQQNDRYLFLFLLGVGLVAAGFAFRYLLRRDERKSQAMHDAFNANTAAQLQLGRIIERNTNLIEHNADILEQTKDELMRHGVKPHAPCRDLNLASQDNAQKTS